MCDLTIEFDEQLYTPQNTMLALASFPGHTQPGYEAMLALPTLENGYIGTWKQAETQGEYPK